MLENPPDDGVNVHILAHIPRDRLHAFLLNPKSWIRLSGGRLKAGGLRGQPIWFHDAENAEYLEHGVKPLLRCMMRGLVGTP